MTVVSRLACGHVASGRSKKFFEKEISPKKSENSQKKTAGEKSGSIWIRAELSGNAGEHFPELIPN